MEFYPLQLIQEYSFHTIKSNLPPIQKKIGTLLTFLCDKSSTSTALPLTTVVGSFWSTSMASACSSLQPYSHICKWSILSLLFS